MHFALFSFITILTTTQAGPLPKLRYRPPKWVKLQPIRLMASSKEAFEMPNSRKFDADENFEETEPLQSLNEGRSTLNKNILRSNDDEDRPLDKEELAVINDMISLLRQNEAIEINTKKRSVFENKGRFNEKDIRSIFGKNDYIHLTKKKNKRHNNLLNIVEHLIDEDVQSDQDDRAVMEALGLNRGLRRQGVLPAKLAYDFNELVNK